MALEHDQSAENWSIKYLIEDWIGHTAETKPWPREEIWASDLGKPFADRWLQMRGVPYSNPATGKDLVSFFLGRQVEQGLAGMLTICGVAYVSQEKVRVEEPDCLPVVGKPDLVLEVLDWDAVLETVDKQTYQREGSKGKKEVLRELVKGWQARYPRGLRKTIFEIKAVKSGAFNPKLRGGKEFSPYPNHKLQLFTYMKGMGVEEGHLIYVDRGYGDVREFVIRPTADLEAEWTKDVRTMTDYFNSAERPPLEPVKVDGKTNWVVTYSRYKDLLYGKGTDDGFRF